MAKRGKKVFTSKAAVAKLVSARRRGVSVYTLAHQHGVSEPTIRRALHAAAKAARPKRKAPKKSKK